jgi:sugar (pentulose or hexulose) kinase
MQIVADATGLPIESVGGSDSAARGAARLARSAASADAIVFRVEPRPAWRSYHSERLSQYVTTYEALRSTREIGESRA